MKFLIFLFWFQVFAVLVCAGFGVAGLWELATTGFVGFLGSSLIAFLMALMQIGMAARTAFRLGWLK